MEKMQFCRCGGDALKWHPAAVTALAASPDGGSRVAAARADGSLEIWLVPPGVVGWHCQLTIQGDANARMSSLVWCDGRPKTAGLGRLLSSAIDGTISEWDLIHFKQKISLESIGVSIWQMALEPSRDTVHSKNNNSGTMANGHAKHDADSELSSIDDDDDSDDDLAATSSTNILSEFQRLAFSCDDGCVRLYDVPATGSLNYLRSLPRVSGKSLSVTWSCDAKFIFSGSSDGLIRCWDAKSYNEVYRITAGLGGANTSRELCVWSLLSLSCGTLVSGDSTGSVQFWDDHLGTLLQAHTYHTGDVNALATVPGHNKVFSAGSDGQVILYKLSSDANGIGSEKLVKEEMSKWSYVAYVRAHTHDVRALAVTVPITKDDIAPNVKVKKIRGKEKPVEFSYHKWAHVGVPMLMSAGDDAKIFAYSAEEFTLFAPHDICPAPQRPVVSLAGDKSVGGEASMMLVQSATSLDVLLVKSVSGNEASTASGITAPKCIAHIKSKGARKILCSAISNDGTYFAYSDYVKPRLLQRSRHRSGKGKWPFDKIELPKGLPRAHCIVFSVDSSNLFLAGHDRKIYVVDIEGSELISTYKPERQSGSEKPSSSEPTITKMFLSLDGQWLAAVNCFGDIYVYSLKSRSQHWFIYRMDGASVTAGGFSPKHHNLLVVITSLNEVHVFDVKSKQLSEWSRKHTHRLPRRFLEYPGEVIGLSFPPCLHTTSVIVYSSRAMCFIDIGWPTDQEEENHPKSKDKGKRKKQDEEIRKYKNENFNIRPFDDPVLYAGHLSENSILLVEKSWTKVVQELGEPVHRHIYGT